MPVSKREQDDDRRSLKKAGSGLGRGGVFFAFPVKGAFFFAAFFLGSLIFFSCASASFARVDGEVGKENYSGGAVILEKEKNTYYSNRDLILYSLDKGMLTHYAGQYEDSSRLLEDGERAIEEAFTKSLTLEMSTYLVNDNVREYGGEDYEDIYINAFNSLNYYHRGNIEGALVEVRRMNNKARYLSDKYGVMLTNLQKKALDESAVIPPNVNAELKFTDSALARYLGMLFYRGSGRNDDARIDRDQLLVAFANAPNVYKHPVPSSVGEELNIPPGMARLNVLGFSGLSPVKQEETLRIPLPRNRWAKIALPVMVKRPSAVSGIEVIFDDGRRFDLELLEDIDEVARETFEKRKGLIYLKTIIRATMKAATSVSLDAAADKEEGNTGLALGILSLAAQVYAEASEQADLRISRYFPAKAWTGGINLEPGVYSFRVNFYGSGRPLASLYYEDIKISAGVLNLTEAVCLK
jgi:hypothetical protein